VKQRHSNAQPSQIVKSLVSGTKVNTESSQADVPEVPTPAAVADVL
jgi:hypothetical protein